MVLARAPGPPRRPADGPSGHDVHAERPSELDEPLEQLGRLERLDHDGDPDLLTRVSQNPRPLPSAEVRQGEDARRPRRPGLLDVLEALDDEAGVELSGAELGRRNDSTQ